MLSRNALHFLKITSQNERSINSPPIALGNALRMPPLVSAHRLVMWPANKYHSRGTLPLGANQSNKQVVLSYSRISMAIIYNPNYSRIGSPLLPHFGQASERKQIDSTNLGVPVASVAFIPSSFPALRGAFFYWAGGWLSWLIHAGNTDLNENAVYHPC